MGGLLAQATLKYLLNFGQVSPFLGYNALEDFFPNYPIPPNENCGSHWCRKRQEEYKKKQEAEREAEKLRPKAPVEEQRPVEIENEWGIEITDSSDGVVVEAPKEEKVDTKGANLADLMAQLKKANAK